MLAYAGAIGLDLVVELADATLRLLPAGRFTWVGFGRGGEQLRGVVDVVVVEELRDPLGSNDRARTCCVGSGFRGDWGRFRLHGRLLGKGGEVFRRIARSNTPVDGAPRNRREGRGFGPFTGGQLTMIIIAIVVAVGLPVGAFAVVSGTNIFVTDASSGATAKVTKSGQLQTHVNGNITPAAAVDLFTKQAVPGSNGYCAAIAPPAGHAVIINSITLSAAPEAEQYPTSAEFFISRGADVCDNPTAVQRISTVTAPTGGQVTVPLPAGLVVPDGGQLLVQAYTITTPPNQLNVQSGYQAWTLTVNGYQVPDSQCPTFHSCLLGE